MSDDIVTRLRELGRYVNTEGGRWFEPITTEAADEIEGLRAICLVLATAPVGSSAWNNARQAWAVRGE